MMKRDVIRKSLATAILSVAVLALIAGAAGAANIETNYSNFTNWLPVVFAAISLSILLVGLWYMAGAAAGSSRAKASAVSEMTQVVATAFIVVLIMGFLTFWNGIALPSFLAQKSTFQGMCTGPYLAGSALDWSNSVYVSPSGVPSPTNIICTQVIGSGSLGGTHITSDVDYGLGAAYLLAANMTNQTAANLNSLYFFEGTAGWLRSFTSTTTFCIPVECAIPLYGERLLSITYEYSPFTAYVYQRSVLPVVEILNTMIFYLFFLQTVGILMMIYMWPYLLAAGIILRVTFFTRRIGGFLIALVLASVIIYPMLIIFEYDTLSPGSCGPLNTNANCLNPIGTTSIPNMAICQLPLYDNYGMLVKGSGSPCELPYPASTCSAGSPLGMQQCLAMTTYQLSFYSMPRVDQIMNYWGCWPPGGSLVNEEIAYSSRYLIPFFGIATGGFGFLSGLLSQTTAIPSTLPQAALAGYYRCFEPTYMAKADFQIINAYGVISVAGFVIPLLNVLLSISALLGLSAMLGGDTYILGLARFI